MPMISSQKSSLYPLPKAGLLGKFFYASLDSHSRFGIFALLKPPALAKVRFRDKAFRIAVPWHVFGAKLEFQAGICLRMPFLYFFNKEPKSIDEIACQPALPNMRSGKICYGRTRPWRKSRVDRYMEDLYRNYWMGRFTAELRPDYDGLPEEIKGSVKADGFDKSEYVADVLGAWERATKKKAKLTWNPHDLLTGSRMKTLVAAI